jgi:hypothetical protein
VSGAFPLKMFAPQLLPNGSGNLDCRLIGELCEPFHFMAKRVYMADHIKHLVCRDSLHA